MAAKKYIIQKFRIPIPDRFKRAAHNCKSCFYYKHRKSTKGSCHFSWWELTQTTADEPWNE